jgi:hypothetical protein
MLTGDENIVDIQFIAVPHDAAQYLFNVKPTAGERCG